MLRNEKFDANDWFANAAGRERSAFRQNQFGGTFSGPVLFPRFGEGGRQPGYDGRNRTFFFFSYEGLRLVLPQVPEQVVPSLRLREVAAPAIRPLVDAFPLPDGPEILTNTPCPVPPAPPNPACDPATNRLFSGFSLFTGVYSDPSRLDATSIRIDHTVNQKLTLFGRYNYAPSNTKGRGTGEVPSSRIIENQITTRSLTIGATAAVTARLSNELRLNLSRDRSRIDRTIDDFGGAVPIDLSAVIPNSDTFGANISTQINILFPSGSGILQLGTTNGFTQRQMNLVDNMSLVKGDHQLKFGIDYRRLTPIYSPVDYGQIIGLSNEAQVRAGTANVNVFSNQGSRPVFENISVYGQDRWKPSPRLTVDLGLRWEINPAPRDADGKRPIGVIGVDNLPTARLAPPDTEIYKTYYGALAPRVGVAYQLAEANGWERVLRGGFGVFYDLGSSQAAAGFTQFPFAVSKALTNVPFPVPPALAAPPPFGEVRLPITSLVLALNPDLTLPYTLQWNVSIEQSLGPNQTVSASYVAAAARRLLVTQRLNQAVAGRRPNPDFGQITFISNGPTSDYHSLQLQYQRRLSRGLQALVNYTWSHAIDEVSDEVTSGVLERGNANFDVRHSLSSAITYNLPGQGLGGVVGKVFGNWSIDGIVYAQSGTPVNPNAGFLIREDGTFILVRPDVVEGQPLYMKDSRVAGGRRFNIAAFNAPPVGANGQSLRQGTLGRNVLRGLPLYQVDVAVRRQFNLTERLKVQIRAEAFNLFNHPNFAYAPGGIGSNISNPSTLGVPSQMLGRNLGGLSPLYQIGGPRSLQFSLRVSF